MFATEVRYTRLHRGAWILGAWLALSGPAMAQSDAPASPKGGQALEERLAEASSRLRNLYAVRGDHPIWQDAEIVDALVESLKTLDADGLVPSDYRPDELQAAARTALMDGTDDETRARFELQASRTLMTALMHLQRGKVDPHRIDDDWDLSIEPPSLDLAAISRALDDGDVSAAIDLARPPYEPYEQLREGLAHYREIERQGGWPALMSVEEPLRPGDTGEGVTALRERLASIGNTQVVAADEGYYPSVELQAPEPRVYDEALVDAVRRFQRHHLLADDGVVGPRTLEALNMSVDRRIDQIRANMERARWLLHGLPESFVLVDIAGYDLRYFRPNGDTWRARIVVGQPYRRTPSLRSEITHLTINPTWTVPPTIMREDVLPKVRRDPGYLATKNLSVLSPSGKQLDPNSIDWSNPGGVMLRQQAGPNNPLGQLVVRFPNDHMVYLHDTPSRGLFSRSQRALSSGCIRVEGVLELAQLLFDDTDTRANVRRLIADGKTRNVLLARHVPVVLHYWTVQPEPDGELAFRPDIYDRDGALIEALDRSVTL
ncbi:L,D-transpeptidase family protein [Halomonas eurihalina]|uniref:L,D-transpeptidase family protein n=1 Tax=Halomonas eurihalina TaxID=42566 RepID=A0A5D9DCA8_HALER|nr:L,D-transpeptidase family protein [Halomonas eurihalina]MDR5858055.1 L,D-transpeptidase family protein [Halomonas eurihalina]TZG41436.1 L,D-transpeptidase family protein [Halomonas eurihalina]